MIATDVWIDVAPIVYLVSVPLVLVAALVFAVALCRTAARNNEPVGPPGDDGLLAATRRSEASR